MFTWMRTHQRWLMLLITILVIVSFIWLFNASQFEQIGKDGVARIYGRNVTYTEMQRDAQMFRLALMLGLSEYASTLEGTNFSGDGQIDFVLNSMIVRHEGNALGIVPTDAQIEEAIRQLPVFQTNSAFDPAKYQSFVQNALAPHGFVPKHVDEIVRDSLILQEVTRLIDSVPTATDVEVAVFNRAFQPASGQAILFNRADFTDKAKVSQEDIDAYYTVNKSRFVTPEWRTANYVRFSLPEEAAKLEGPAKIEAQQKIADAAEKFSDAAAAEGFEKAASAAGYKVETTLPFDRQGKINDPSGVMSNLAELSGPAAAISPTIFTLTKESPVSGVIADGNDFLVAELEDIREPQQLTSEEAKPQIASELAQLSAEKLLEEDAAKAIGKLRSDMSAGKSFSEAAAALNLKTEAFADVAPLGENPDARLRMFADATTSLRDGELSGFRPTQEGGLVVWLEKRGPAAVADTSGRDKQITDYVVGRKRSILFYEWLIWARERSGLQLRKQG